MYISTAPQGLFGSSPSISGTSTLQPPSNGNVWLSRSRRTSPKFGNVAIVSGSRIRVGGNTPTFGQPTNSGTSLSGRTMIGSNAVNAMTLVASSDPCDGKKSVTSSSTDLQEARLNSASSTDPRISFSAGETALHSTVLDLDGHGVASLLRGDDRERNPSCDRETDRAPEPPLAHDPAAALFVRRDLELDRLLHAPFLFERALP